MFERLKEFLARVWAAVVGVWRALVTLAFSHPSCGVVSWIYGRPLVDQGAAHRVYSSC